MLTDEKITAIAAAIVIAALSLYIGVLRGQVRDTTERAGENLRRAEAAERRADELQRAADALREAQAHADRTRQEIAQTHADVLWRIDDIIDSGALDERGCERARAAYDSLGCAADGDTVPAASTARTP